MSRTRRAVATFVATGVGAAVALAVTFVTTPLLLHHLGAERLGLFRAALEWAGYLSLLEVGVSAAVGPLVVKAAAREANGEPGAVVGVLAAGARAFARVAPVLLVAGLVVAVALPALTRCPEELSGELRIGFAVCAAFAVFLPLSVYKPLADARQRGYWTAGLAAVAAAAAAVGCVLVAAGGGGLIGQFAVTAAAGLIVPVALLLRFRREAPPGAVFRAAPPPDAIRDLRALNRPTLLSFLIGRVCLFTDNIVIGLFLGPSAVASFFLTTRLIQAAGSQVQAVGGATWAGLAELWQSGRHDLFRERLVQLTRLTAVLAGAVVVPLAVLTEPFVTLWVGADQYAGPWVAGLAAFNAALLPVFSLWGYAFSGTGRIGRLVPYSVAQGGLTLGALALLTWRFGTVGPPLAVALVNAAYNSWWLGRLLWRDFGVSPVALVRAVVEPLAAATAVAVAATSLSGTPETWSGLGVRAAAATVAFAAVVWAAVLPPADRARLAVAFTRTPGRSE